MSADAAMPEDVLMALTVIDKYLTTLPDDGRPLSKQFGVFCAALIQFTSRQHLRYLIGDDNG